MKVQVSTIRNIFDGAVKLHGSLHTAKAELEAARDLIDGGLSLVKHAETFAGKLIAYPGLKRLVGQATQGAVAQAAQAAQAPGPTPRPAPRRPVVIDAIFEETPKGSHAGRSGRSANAGKIR